MMGRATTVVPGFLYQRFLTPGTKATILLIAVGLIALALGCSTQTGGRDELLVFAAASLSDAFTEAGQEYEIEGGNVSFSFGGSQALARQIASGAPADVFVTAGRFPIEFLSEEELIEPETVDLLSNKLVVVVREDGPGLTSIDQLGSGAVERIAVADPDLAPAGRYAREALTNLGVWKSLEQKLVIGSDVRATLVYLETGNVDAALVYTTDALVAEGVRVLDIVPSEKYSPVVYPAVVVSRSETKGEARRFIEFLSGESANAIFIRHGFEPMRP
jgi:molybdate transport system substrate-binding protein